MASEHLVGEVTLRLDKSLLKNVNSAPGSIDRGSTLTKIMYATSTDNDQELELHFALFRNKHFESALEFLRGKLMGAEDAAASGRKLHVTGVGANLHGDKIKEVLGLDTEFIDEAYCQFAGFHFLLKHFPLKDICDPLPTIDDPVYAPIQGAEVFEQIRKTQAAVMKDQEDIGGKFPCLFALYGSSAGVILIKEDGSIEVKHRHLFAGKSFLGLCQLLIGTSNYAEIMALAATGKRGNIDTQVRDILADSPNSPYGRMAPTLPFLPFGKAVDFDKSLESTRPDDVAHSLVSAFAVNFSNTVTFIANYEKVRNVFFGGNFFQDHLPRLEVARSFKVAGLAEMIRASFLRTGHTGALGAMLSSRQDVTDFFAAMKLKD